MPLHVYRVLIDARPVAPSGVAPAHTEHAVISVAVRAADAKTAESEALTMLPACGWMPLGNSVRTSDLTRLLQGGSRHDAFDSAYGEFAQQWLQIVHDEAAEEGATLHLLSIDYEYLDHPRRITPPYPL